MSVVVGCMLKGASHGDVSMFSKAQDRVEAFPL